MRGTSTFLVALAFLLVPAQALASPDAKNFGTHATGAEEVPSRDTPGQGQIILKLNTDGTLDYRLIASNIENVVQAHLHLAPEGVNGSVVTFLYGPVPAGGGRQNGVLATGTITDASLIGPLAGATVSDLVDAINAGDVYVNVHTDNGTPPPNEGAGDFPGGEVRGQVEALGPEA